MTNIKKYLFLTSFFLILLSTCFMNSPSSAFATQATYTDAKNDHTWKNCPGEDVWYVWLDYDTTYIKFKLEFNGSFEFGTNIMDIYISINETTGNNDGGNIDFNANYRIRVVSIIYFYDLNNGTNNLVTNLNGTGHAYSVFTNGNRIVEIGFKLKTYYNGGGYLNISLGATVKIKFKLDSSSDYAPDWGSNPLSYTLAPPGSEIPGFELLLVLIPIILVGFYRQKKR